jgi:hypothetical protein
MVIDEQSYDMNTHFTERNIVQDPQSSNLDCFVLEVTCLPEKQHYRPLPTKMNIFPN